MFWEGNKLSYNGIYIDNIGNYDPEPNEWNLVAGRIILKDMHRPELSVSRSGIKRLSLELTCMGKAFEMYLKHAQRNVFHFARGYNLDVTLEDFKKVLHVSPSLVECMYINTWGGIFHWHEIAHRLQQGKPVILYIGHLDFMIICLSIAVLLEHFDVRFEIRQANYPIISVFLKNEKTMAAAPDPPGNFLPGLFLYTIDRKTEYLSTGTREHFHVYNADHPFSKWLISNSDLIKEKSPDILKALCHCMTFAIAHENSDRTRMDEINKYLRILKNSKNVPVPDEVFLKNSDFFSLDKAFDE